MATYASIETEVRANVNNATATVSGVIDQAINLLSNFFHNKKISTSVDTVASQDYIAKPSHCLEVINLKIGDNFFKKTTIEGIEEAEEYELKKFYEYGDNIQLIPTPDEVEDCIIWYKAGFTPLAGVAGATTDIPDNKLPALYILATWLYWLRVISNVGTEREDFPDMTVDEAEKIADSWGKQFKEIIAIIKAK